MIRGIIFLAIVAGSFVNSSPTIDCFNYDGSTLPVINYSLQLEGCDDGAQHCPLYLGKNQTLNTTFQVSETITGVINSLHGIFKIPSKWKVPYLPEPSSQSICDLETNECAEEMEMEPGHNYEHRFIFFTKNGLPPGVKLHVEYKLVESHSNVVFCQLIPVQLTPLPPQE